MNYPKVSIIVPVYNVEKYLSKCLNSLINQTLREIEILCVDDGSTDNSAKILENFVQKDCRVKVFSQKNSGQSVARNVAIEHASGEYLGFVDSDDWVDLDYFEKLYSAAKNMTAILLVPVLSVVKGLEVQSKKHTKKSKYTQTLMTKF